MSAALLNIPTITTSTSILNVAARAVSFGASRRGFSPRYLSTLSRQTPGPLSHMQQSTPFSLRQAQTALQLKHNYSSRSYRTILSGRYIRYPKTAANTEPEIPPPMQSAPSMQTLQDISPDMHQSTPPSVQNMENMDSHLCSCKPPSAQTPSSDAHEKAPQEKATSNDPKVLDAGITLLISLACFVILVYYKICTLETDVDKQRRNLESELNTQKWKLERQERKLEHQEQDLENQKRDLKDQKQDLKNHRDWANDFASTVWHHITGGACQSV